MQNIKRICFIVTLLLVSSAIVHAQPKEVKPLKIGDKVPDILFRQVLNYSSKTARISDFKGKLLILDFWHSWCTVCVAQFPKLKTLQDQFKDKVVILPVGFDFFEKGSIEKLLNKRKGTRLEIQMPTVVQKEHDSLLLRIFPVHRGFPQEIWIDKQGRLLAITDHHALTPTIISRFRSAGTRLNPYFFSSS